MCAHILNKCSVPLEVLTAPERACIALVGVQPGFSAECSVLAGTATTPPAEKLWQPGPSFWSTMIHPTNSPAQHMQDFYVRLFALMHGAYGVMLYDDPLTTLNQQAVQPASRCHNLSRTGIMVMCCSIKQESHLAAATDWCRFSCLTFNDVCHLTEVYMQHRQPDPCIRLQ